MSAVQSPPPQPKKNFIFGSKKILPISFLIIIIAILSIFLISSKNETKKTLTPSSSSSSKTWKIILSYNAKDSKLSLKEISIIDKTIRPDYRNANFSRYNLSVLDKDEEILFATKVNIAERIMYNYFTDDSQSAKTLFPSELTTVLYIPYYPSATKIVIKRGGATVIQIMIKAQTSFEKLVPEVFAVSSGVSCGPLTAVFINDNFSDINEFRNSVQYLQNIFNSKAPYNPSIFNFKEIDEPQNYNCDQSGVASCLSNSSQNIVNTGSYRYPGAQQFIVLTDSKGVFPVDHYFGIALFGGPISIITNYSFSGSPPFPSAVHEFEGHAVASLHDRYVSSDNYDLMGPGSVKSNCSDNPAGEYFWSQSGSTGVYKGCANQVNYSPFPLSCSTTNPRLLSGGTNDSVMSAIGCGSYDFDSVEQYWIANNILPSYKPCPATTPTPTPPPGGDCTKYGCDGPNLTVTWNRNSIDPHYKGQLTQRGDPYHGACFICNPSCASGYRLPNCTDSFNNLYTESFTFTGLSPNMSYDLYVWTIENNGLWSSKTVGRTGACTGGYCALTPTSAPRPTSVLTPTSVLPSIITPTSSALSPSPSAGVTIEPTPTPVVIYNCVSDPACASGQKNIQLCPLICTPK